LAHTAAIPAAVLFDATEALESVGKLLRPGSGQAAPKPVASSLAIRTTFERFELKYWVTEPLAQRVLQFAAPYLKRDPYSTTYDAQRNTTLYLDTRGFQFAENHELLSPDRSKLRIRVYGIPLGKLAFFEVKRKVKTITLKERFALPVPEVTNVLGRRPVTCTVPEDAHRTLSDFTFQMLLHRAVPKLYVACHREAFESLIPGEDVRLTVDRELVYQTAYNANFAVDERAWKDINEGDDTRPAFGRRRCMLELKFDGSPPRWMTELVRHFNLQREAYSKYTTAATQLRGRI
jgi:VTC domain